MTLLTDASVKLSWDAVIISGVPIHIYTVIFSAVSSNDRLSDREITAVFPGSVTSGVISDLESAITYRFQIFATVTVDGVSVEGEWSNAVFASSN